MPLIVRCPLCKGNKEYEEDDLQVSSLLCPNCNEVSRIEDYSVMTFCPNCHQKLAIPANMINVEEIYCAKCDFPFKPNTSFSLEKNTVESELTNYNTKEKKQIYKCGSYFDKYEIISLLGRGGMGEVYLAKHLLLNKTVALKIMRAQAAAKNPVTAKRFIREAKLANKIKSPNIIDVYDVGIEQKNNNLFIAMEYVDGLNLHEMLHLRGKFSEFETLHIANEVCNALLLMEENKIVHRDIKPSNIMINSKKEVKLADLGIAKVDSSTFEGELTLTQENLVFGTPEYASPEQCRASHNTDTRSDIYSLGATMYYMVTGVSPFKGENAMDTIVKVINEPLPDISLREPNLTYAFYKLLNDMMAKSPEARPQTITELKARIQQAIEGNESIDTSNNNNSLKRLGAFLHKIDRLSLMKNWNITENPTATNTGINVLTKFCKIAGIIIFILGILSLIGIIDKRIATIFQPPEKKIPKVLPPPQQSKKVTKYPTSNVAKQESTPQKNTIKNTLKVEEFSKLYHEIFLANSDISTPQSFTSIKSRLDRAKKILNNKKLIQYKNLDSRFHDIFNFYTQQKDSLLQQLKYSQLRTQNLKSSYYSSYATREIKEAINTYFIHVANHDVNRQNIVFSQIKELFENKYINLDMLITIPKKVKYSFNYTTIYPTKIDEDLTLCLIAIVFDKNSSQYPLCKYLKELLKKRFFNIPCYQSLDYKELIPLGIEDYSNALLNSAMSLDENDNTLSLALIKNGNNVNVEDSNGNTILHHLTRTSNLEVIKSCLLAGCNINKTNKDGETALFIAERYCNEEVRNLLLQFGCNPNIKNKVDKTAKFYRYMGEFNVAIKQSNFRTLKLLLQKYPHLKDEFLWNKYTPCQYAIITKHPKLLKLFLDNKANLEKYHPERNLTTLQLLHLNVYPKTIKALDKYKLKTITKLVTSQNVDIFTTTNVNGGKILLVQLNSSTKKSYFAEHLLRSLAEKFDTTKDLPILLDKLTKPYKKIISPFTTISANYTSLDFEVLTLLLEQSAWMNNSVLKFKEQMPEILGRLAIDVKCLKILSKYGFNFKTLDTKGKSTLDYFILALAKELNYTDNLVVKVDEFLSNPTLDTKYKKYLEKYQYLLTKGLKGNKLVIP